MRKASNSINNKWQRSILYFIPSQYKKDSEEYNKAALLISVFLLSALISLTLTILGFYISLEMSEILMPISALTFLAIAYFIKNGMNLIVCGNLYVVFGSFFIILLIIYTGGIYSPAALWMMSGPTVSLLLVNRKWAWIWFFLALFAIGVFAVLEWQGLNLPFEYEKDKKLFYYISSFSSLAFLLMMINLFFEKNKNEAKRKVDAANKSITDSINYAKRIQTAILPTEAEINKIFAENFVLFQPKDIISGDFYWVAESDGKKFIGVADCTGHGVPGALMSAVGIELLNKILFEKKITHVDEILNTLHSDLCSALRQSSSDMKDGMDIILCSFSEHEMEYSGAKNPLYYVADGAIQKLDANREAIGGDNSDRQFSKHKITFSSNTTFYFCTDGIQDQFGGQKEKKFMVKQLKKCLLEISNSAIDVQKNKLVNIISNWKDGHEQTDDILIIGIKCFS